MTAAHDPDQAWFWTDEWQAGEREADAYHAEHGGKVALSEPEFLAFLDGEIADIKASRARQ